MADLSVIKLPNSSSYNLKDSQALASAIFSGHELTLTKRGTGTQVVDLGEFDTINVTDANVGNLIVTGSARFTNGVYGITYPDLQPLEQKIYASTSHYATTASSNATAAFFFMSVRPDSWYLPWTVKFKVRSFCPAYSNYDSVTYATWSGSEGVIAYANWNQRASYYAHYYLPYYPLTQAGFNAGYGHAIGVNLLYASNYTNSAYYRTFEVEYYEAENCTVTLLNSPVLWSNWTGGNSTNYGTTIQNTNAIDRGLQETGDSNSTTISTLYCQYGNWTSGTAIKRYELLFQSDDRHLVALNELDNQYSNTTKELSTTTKFDPLGKIYYYNSSGLYENNVSIAADRLYYSVLTDMRYTFNISSNNASGTYTCTVATPCYLKVSIGTDGMATIASNTQPLTSTLPSSADGYYYIYLGRGYDWYRIMLSIDHPVYCYTANGLERYWGKTVKASIVDATTFTGNATSATKATQDESGNNIKANYAASFSISGHTITLKNKNGESLGTVTVPDNDANTWRAIQVNGTEILAGNSSTALNLKAGTNVSLSNSSGTVTIAATDTKYDVVSKTANGLVPQLPNETTTTKYLRQDGSWAVPPDNNTHNIAYIYAGASDGSANAATTTGNTHLILKDGSSVSSRVKLVPGTNMAIASDASGNVTFTSSYTNTTYTFANGTNGFTVTPSGGTAQTVTVTPSIANNITGSGTSGYLAKFNGANTITNGPQLASTTANKFLRDDGTWQASVVAGTGISVSGTTVNHSNSVTAGTAGTSSATSGPTIAVPYITYDAQGHITAVGTHTHTVNGALSVTSLNASSYVGVNSGSSGTAGGLALYGTTPTDYGIAMRNVSNGGAHGYVSGDWATYFYMKGTSAANSLTRGWIFKNVTNGNVGSISGAGNAVFNGSVTIGGNTGNTSGCRMEYDAALGCVNWIFN